MLAGSSGSSSHQLTPVESFKRSVKRDSNQFTNFKEGKCWDTWRRNDIATSRAQHVNEILAPDYTPLTQEKRILFSEKNKCMHHVFFTTLQTYRGNKFVRDNERDFDALIVYKKFHGFYATSIGALISVSGMLSYINSAKFDV